MSGTLKISTKSRRELSLSFSFSCKAPKEIHAILTETLACFLPGQAKDLSAPCIFTNIPFCVRAHVYDCCETSGFHHHVNEILPLLGCETVYINIKKQTFRDNISVPLSGAKESKNNAATAFPQSTT